MVHRLRLLWALRVLPPRVALFYLRARRLARREGDAFSLESAARPPHLRQLFAAARGRRRAIELGTGTAWTAVALALEDPRRRILTCDPIVRPERDLYLGLAPDAVRERIELERLAGEDGPPAGWEGADFLFLDADHGREGTVATFRAWEPSLAPGAPVVFHDYGHPGYPGVKEAVEELGLRGEAHPFLFVWRKPERLGKQAHI